MKAHRSYISSSEVLVAPAAAKPAARSWWVSLRPFAWAALILVVLELAARALLPAAQLDRAFAAGRQRVEQLPAPRVQLMGDSVVAGGVFTGLIGSEELGVRNDGVQATTPVHTYFMFKSQIENGRRPQYLILAHHPRTFETVRVPALIASFARWSEVPDILWTSGGSRDASYGVLTKGSHLLRHRDQLRALLTRADTAWLVEPAAKQLSEDERITSYLQQRERPDFRLEAPGTQHIELQRRPFVVSKQNDIYFRRLLALARREQIPVYWVHIPVSPQVRELRASQGHDAGLKEYLQQFVTSGELSVLGAGPLVLPADHFEDWSHVNTAGAIRFSCHIGYLWRTVRTPASTGIGNGAASVSSLPAVCQRYSQDWHNGS
jgi:hypothetical protein